MSNICWIFRERTSMFAFISSWLWIDVDEFCFPTIWILVEFCTSAILSAATANLSMSLDSESLDFRFSLWLIHALRVRVMRTSCPALLINRRYSFVFAESLMLSIMFFIRLSYLFVFDRFTSYSGMCLQSRYLRPQLGGRILSRPYCNCTNHIFESSWLNGVYFT